MARDVLRIGCGAGFWGDSAEAPRQLIESGQIDVLMLDYLAEITMSLLARARARNPDLGYATDFPDVVARNAAQLKDRGVRIVTNAGGVNPLACKAAIDGKLKELGIDLKVAAVTGDDLMPQAAALRAAGVREMFDGSAMPENLWSMNAYLGAFPIAAAFDAGADIVVTGRCVDSALALGALIHEFRWRVDQYHELAAGSLAGHVIECGAQATGGISTDWHAVSDDWDRMGYPIAECRRDGSFVVTKPRGTGGRVCRETVAEQIVYEIGDPGAYALPDVLCDFRDVTLTEVGEDRVEVRGVRGSEPGDQYKVSATYQDGFRATGMMMIGGVEAVAKAEAVAAAILRRTRRLFTERGWSDYLRTDVEVLGSESNWGAHGRRRDTREVILKIAVHHADKAALELFGRECIPPATSMAQGITGFAGGRPAPTPLVRLFSCLVPKSTVTMVVDGLPYQLPKPSEPRVWADAPPTPPRPNPPVPPAGEPSRTVPLIAIAYGRSGDKGNMANIGVLARKPEYLPLLRDQLTVLAVRKYFDHFVHGPVQRYEWPGLDGFNFLLADALGGGGMASLRHDPQGKMFAQILMSFPIQLPVSMLPGISAPGA